MGTSSRIRFSLIAGIAATTIFAVVGLTTDRAGASLCTPSGYYWSGSVGLDSANPLVNTGIVIPAPLPGQELKINEISYSVLDGGEADRTIAPELHEQLGVNVGGVAAGGLSTDLPDDAAHQYSTGIFSGTLGAADAFSAGGEIQIRHSSLYGFDGSNSLTVISITVHVVFCAEPTTTTSPPSTVTPTTVTQTSVPATTTPVTTVPATTVPATTVQATTVPPTAPATTTTLTAATRTTAAPTTVATALLGAGASPATTLKPPVAAAKASIPAAGVQAATTSMLAFLFAFIGAALLVARRRPTQA